MLQTYYSARSDGVHGCSCVRCFWGWKVTTRHDVLASRATKPFFIPRQQYKEVIEMPVLDAAKKEFTRKIIEHGGAQSLYRAVTLVCSQIREHQPLSLSRTCRGMRFVSPTSCTRRTSIWKMLFGTILEDRMKHIQRN